MADAILSKDLAKFHSELGSWRIQGTPPCGNSIFLAADERTFSTHWPQNEDEFGD